MKFTVLIVSVCVVLGLASALENRTGHRLVNRPKLDVFGPRLRRAPATAVKGGGIKVHPLFDFPHSTSPRPELSVRKGEYICGERVCKLPAGVEPPGCRGLCQYPVL